MFTSKEKKFHNFYMNMAFDVSQLSNCERKKVGAVIVRDNNILSYGFNGTPHGFDNKCEIETESNEIVTKKEVLHAELNAICKIACSTNTTENSILYVTLSPCIECAKIIIQSGIKSVFYNEEYRITDGIDFLKKALINVYKI